MREKRSFPRKKAIIYAKKLKYRLNVAINKAHLPPSPTFDWLVTNLSSIECQTCSRMDTLTITFSSLYIILYLLLYDHLFAEGQGSELYASYIPLKKKVDED